MGDGVHASFHRQLLEALRPQVAPNVGSHHQCLRGVHMGLHDDQRERGSGVLGAIDSTRMRDGPALRVGTVQDSKSPGTLDTMNDGTIAGAIAAGLMVFVGVIIKMRGHWSSTTRQVNYDESAQQWQIDRQKELEEMRLQRNKMWEERTEDRVLIAKLQSENMFLQQKVGLLETRIAVLEGQK